LFIARNVEDHGRHRVRWGVQRRQNRPAGVVNVQKRAPLILAEQGNDIQNNQICNNSCQNFDLDLQLTQN